jgi:hypothetical protein
MILSNGQVGPPLPTLQKNDNSTRDANTQEHLKTRAHSIELYGTSNNFSTGTEIIASMASYKA